MSLRDWLTLATPATPATVGSQQTPSVATVATVAGVVNSPGTYFAWQVRTPAGWREVRFVPPADRARVALHYPNAEAAPMPEV